MTELLAIVTFPPASRRAPPPAPDDELAMVLPSTVACYSYRATIADANGPAFASPLGTSSVCERQRMHCELRILNIEDTRIVSGVEYCSLPV
eukprot:1728603-Prymnesium_polylepis.1